MQFLYDKQVVVKRYSSTLGEFNRPNKTLVEVGTYECHTAETVSYTHLDVYKRQGEWRC